MSNKILTHQLVREVRHPAWTPTNPDGTTPVLGGTATNGPNDWQPIAFGKGDMVTGATPNTKTFRADKGHMVAVSGYSEQDTIEDHSGDGDDAQQMRSVDFEVPQSRTITAICERGYRYISAFLTVVRRDPTRRPMELRETYFEVSASGTIAVDGAVTASAEVTIDGADAADLAVGDLITIAAVVGVRRIESRTATTITLDAPVTAADAAAVSRAARTSRTTQKFLVEGRVHTNEGKTTLKVEATLNPYDAATEEGMQA